MNEVDTRITKAGIGRSLSILLVEDNPADRLLHQAALRRSDPLLDIRLAEDLEEALTALGEHWPDAIILDLSLPDSDGIETFLAIHRRAPEVPVVVLSGLDHDPTIMDAVAAGAQDFLIKGGLREGELLRAVRLAIVRSPGNPSASTETHLAPGLPLLPVRPLSAEQQGASSDATPAPDSSGVATVTSRFCLTAGLGHGGMADVILAQQVGLNREVAVKILREDHRQARHEAMFQTEARVLAQLEHPNIIPVYDVGKYFIVMRRVQGTTLAESLRIHRDGENLSEFIETLIHVCDALSFAHSKGVIHRDIKPENIMLGEHGQVFLLDWGLALCVDPPEHGAPIAPLIPEDRAEVCTGTPAYLAPEIASADRDAIGYATDVFLLGATLYAILARRPLYQNVATRDILATAAAAAFRPIRHVAPGAPEALVALCESATHTDPEQRPSLEDFRLKLREWLMGHV